jgi:hypothetical protein
MAVYRGKLIDLDVHHTWTSPDEIIERLPARWRTVASTVRGNGLPIEGPANSSGPPGGGHRGDSEPEVGPPGSSYPLMREQLLDRYNMERVVLGFNTGRNNGVSNPYFGQALVRAINDWNAETWLSIDDDRLASVVLIPGQFVDEAVAEIERVASHPKIVAGLIGWNSLGKPLGSPVYHPIYEALHDSELMLNVHIGAGEYSNKGGAAMVASGAPALYYDFHVLFPQNMMHHLASLLVHGVFDKYPNLKVVCIEGGVGWLPWLASNLDANYKVLRAEMPSLQRKPSEYLGDHVRITTQPFEASDDPARVIRALSTVNGIERMLCFSTDYPHWDGDNPRYMANRLPDEWQERVFRRNAADTYHWPAPAQISEPVRA